MEILPSFMLVWVSIIQLVFGESVWHAFDPTGVSLLVNKIISENSMQSYTVRILTQASHETNNQWMSYFGQFCPSISGEITSLQTGGPVIAVFLLHKNTSLEQSEQINYMLHWIRSFSNRQQDYFLFVGEKSTLLKVWNTHGINELPKTFGYTFDSLEFVSRIEGKPLEPGFFKKIGDLPPINVDIGSNIRGRHLKVAGWAHVPPYHFIQGKDESGKDVYDGSHVRLFHAASLSFNFTYEIYSVEEAASYGRLLENGSWTGMIGAVSSGAYDIVCYIGPTLIWYDMFDFAGALSGAAIRFMTAKPKSEIKWQAFLIHPFSVNLWISLSIIFWIVLVTMYVLVKLTKSTTNSPIVASSTLTFQIAIEQSTKIPPEVRIICGAWLLFSIITGTAYKSQVMSSLTFPISEKLPSSYEELARLKGYKSILNNIGGLEVSYFQSNDSRVVTTIAKTMTYQPVPMKCIEKAVLIPKTVCIGWFTFLEYVVAEWASPDTQVMPIYISTDSVMPTTVALAFQKHSPYTLGFTPIITSFWESGIYSVWEYDVLRIHKNKGVSNYKANPNLAMNKQLKSIIDDINAGNAQKPLKISNLKMMFLALLTGICLGICIFTFEHIFHKLTKNDNSDDMNETVRIISVRSRWS